MENNLGAIKVPRSTRWQRRKQIGRPSDLNMYWSWGTELNFGDWIGPYIFTKLNGQPPEHCYTADVRPPGSVFFTAGSVFRKIKSPNVAVVWGSGSMHLRTTPEKPKATLAVRGPLSQLILDRSKFDVPEIIGDPGICLPLFYQPSAEKKYRLGIIVHGVDRAYWESQKLPEDVLLIKTDRNIEPVIDDIASCEFTISSSLHGVIESHSYGVPSVWVRPNTNRLLGDDTKFLDYFQSVNMAVDPNDTPRDITISLALSLQSYAALPDHDMTAMAEKLMSCCPFKPD